MISCLHSLYPLYEENDIIKVRMKTTPLMTHPKPLESKHNSKKHHKVS